MNVVKESDASSNVSDIKMETGSSLSYRPYKIDYGNAAVAAPDCTIVGNHAADANSSSGGGSQTTTLSRVCGIPLAGPVPVGPCYSTGYLSHQQNDYADPLNYVRYTCNSVSIIGTVNTNVDILSSIYTAYDKAGGTYLTYASGTFLERFQK